MNKNVIKEIEKFQIDRGLDKQEFNSLNEATNIVEELMKSFGFDTKKDQRSNLLEEFDNFIFLLLEKGISTRDLTTKQGRAPVTKEEKVDAYGDIIVFAIGALLKLGYNPTRVLEQVGLEINSRVGSMINGKFEKDLSMSHLWYKADFSTCKRD